MEGRWTLQAAAQRKIFGIEHSAPGVLLALWLLAMIALPILWWKWGDTAVAWGAVGVVILQASAVLLLLGQSWSMAKVGTVTVLLLSASWLVEWIGSTTGYPFGSYHYTERLQPQIARVPILIPFAWLMMLPAAWAMSRRLTGRSGGLRFALVSGLALMAWDLYLDPQMVGWSFWRWEPQTMWMGGYFGIPWLNFLGWALSGALLTLLCTAFVDLEPLPLASLTFVYTAVWLLEAAGLAFFWGAPGPALGGFVGMGFFVALALNAGRTHVN